MVSRSSASVRKMLVERGLIPPTEATRPRSHRASAAAGGVLTKERKALFVPTGPTYHQPVLSVTIPGEPRSKARARTVTTEDGKVVSFTPKQTVQAEAQIANAVVLLLPGPRRADPHGCYGVQCVFYLGNWRRRDIDNMQKLVLDALTRVVWHDDWQVFETTARKDYSDLGNARTELAIYLVRDVE